MLSYQKGHPPKDTANEETRRNKELVELQMQVEYLRNFLSDVSPSNHMSITSRLYTNINFVGGLFIIESQGFQNSPDGGNPGMGN